ncbi:hypothetical protein CPB85DRAFT_1257932 [Mucidula mucida]|nr:hypothetical protein CPB85DRAFT_1257932 [Mucidula mucida]
MFETTFFAQLNLQDGVYLIPELTEMGIFTPVALRHVAYASFHWIYASLLRAVLGMDKYDENWYAATRHVDAPRFRAWLGQHGGSLLLTSPKLLSTIIQIMRFTCPSNSMSYAPASLSASGKPTARTTAHNSPLKTQSLYPSNGLCASSEAAPPRDRDLERAVGDIPLPYRLADSMRSVLFRANVSGLIPAFEECGILDAANFIQLRALLDAGELWRHILLRVVGLDREDVNYYRLLHLIGWPEDNTNGPSLDDSQNVWSETEDPVQLVPNTLNSCGTPPGPRDDKTALVGHCHIFWSIPRHKILTVNNSDESDSQYDTAPETFVEEDLTNEYPDPEVEGLIRAFRDSDMFKRPPVQSAQAQGTSSVGGDWSQASTSVLNEGAIAKAIRKRYKRPRKVPGIYTTWRAARPSIHEVEGAIFMRYSTAERAQRAFEYALHVGWIRNPCHTSKEVILTQALMRLKAQLNVVGVKGASYELWTTLDEATRKFSAAQRRNEVRAVRHIPGLLYWLMERDQFAHDFSYFGPSLIGRQD